MTDETQRPDSESAEPEATRRRRGCVRPIVWTLLLGLTVIVVGLMTVWFVIGSSPIEELIAGRVESTLEARMGRDVRIGNIEIDRGFLTSVVIEDVRIANADGATHPWFAVVPRIVISGGVESFRKRLVQVGTIEVHEPEVFIEIFPEDASLPHNIPMWERGEPSRFEIARFEMSEIDLLGARVVYLDHRRELNADLRQVNGRIDPDTDEGEINGFLHAESVKAEFLDWTPVDGNLRTGFHFQDRNLELKGARFRTDGVTIDVGGTIGTEKEPVIDLAIAGVADLDRLEEIMALEQELAGTVELESNLEGTGGQFLLKGTASSDRISAAGYELGDVRLLLEIDDETARARIDRASYGGGTLSGVWKMTSYEDPRPMTVDLDYDSVSLEALLGDWNLQASGLRGAAEGSIHYEFEQEGVLNGDGAGNAVLEQGAVAFGRAPYPMPVTGRTDFAIRKGVLRFQDPSVLELPSSTLAFNGTLGLEELAADLSVRIESTDFSEIDRLGVNFGRALGSEDFELLGLGGSGIIDATISRTLQEPRVEASIRGQDVRYNDVLLGRAEIELVWNGGNQTLTFQEGRFRKAESMLTLGGTIRFPEDAEPIFDLAMDAEQWSVQEAINLVDLELNGVGVATGRLEVDGTPERGIARFDQLDIQETLARLTLNGTVQWLPGEGNLVFDLDVGSERFPVSAIVAFLDLGDLPIEGEGTGTLHIEGPIEDLAGAGSFTVRNGLVAGEPVDEAVADIRFVKGSLEVRHFDIRSPAGKMVGQATYDFQNENFSFLLEPTTIDLSKVKALEENDLISGTVLITSSGAGRLDSPELVLEATLRNGSIMGSPVPEDVSPPRLYFALREGEIVIRGSALDSLTIMGEGRIAEEGRLTGTVDIDITEVGQLMSIVNPESDLEVRGGVSVALNLGGSTGSIESLEIGGTINRMNLEVAGEPIVTDEPVSFGLSDGRVILEPFSLKMRNTEFLVEGAIGLTETRELDLRLAGDLRLSLLELFLGEVDTKGVFTVRIDIDGSLSSPRLRGTAELRDASVKLAAFPQLISNIYGSFVMRGDRIDIDSFRATMGGGTIIAGGFVTLQGLRPARVRINTQGDDVTIRSIEGVTATADFDLLLSGDLERQQIRGDVVLSRGLYYEDFDLTQLILQKVLERQAVVPTVAETWQDNVSLRVNLTADDTLAIQNNVADVTASAQLEVVGSLAKPVMLGRVTLNEGGTFEFQDVDYRLVQGTISFQNPFRNDPYFDITAEGVLKSRGQSLGEIEEYELTVNLTGTVDRIVPNISSDPPVGDLTLLTLLSGQVGGSPGLGGRSFSEAGTALVLSQVGEALGGKILPFADAVRFDTVGESGFNPTVTFEKQVSSDVFVIVIYDTASAENVEIIQWQAADNWVLQFTRNSEQRNTYLINAIDARFRRRYEGRW